jgi:hypothetical protein
MKLYLLLFLVIIVGCIAPTKPVSICKEFPDGSYIEQFFPNLQTTNTIIKLSIYEISKLENIGKKEISKFLDGAEKIIDTSGTYQELANYLLPKIKFIQENLGPEVIIIGDDLIKFQTISTPISLKDRCYLKYQIQEDRTKVLPWIK